ncbi:hypothetical protein Vadar_018921 [Vaccinium darrowii]|uniref:Uncharacterized protein n=1 Tax=Vaccinium darrowii TaxID=229202 RepID=A0ACB7YWY6_9ERIC|nr:hypothetical protein Vadar_018921 [Vaccinium darrowii]
MAASPPAVRSTISRRSKKTPTTTVAAPFVRTVFLYNWWLIKIERDSKGRRGLGVAGFEDREGQGTRAFFSAAIVKRHDTVTLETTDGITITLIGFINRSLTAENGSPSEVVNRFRFGFPHNWEQYAGQIYGEEPGNGPIPSKICNLDGLDISSVEGPDSSLPICLDDLPVTCIRDLLMSSGADSRGLIKSIMNDVMQYLEGNEATGNENNDNYGAHSLRTQNFVPKQVPRNHDKTKVDDKCKDDGSIQHSSDRGKLKFSKIAGECETSMDVDSLSGGVMTRSMSRLCNMMNKQENSLSPRTYVTRRLTEVSGDQCGMTVNIGDESSKRPRTIVSDPEVEANGTPRTFTATRFSRLESLSEPLSKSEDNRYGRVLSGDKVNVKQIPDKSALRRSGRLRKIQN